MGPVLSHESLILKNLFSVTSDSEGDVTLKHWAEECKFEFAGFEDGGKLAKECGWSLEAGKVKKKDSHLENQTKEQPYLHLILAYVKFVTNRTLRK